MLHPTAFSDLELEATTQWTESNTEFTVYLFTLTPTMSNPPAGTSDAGKNVAKTSILHN